MAKKIVIALSGGLVGGAGITFLFFKTVLMPSFPAPALTAQLLPIPRFAGVRRKYPGPRPM
jgi:hypothetical protein